MQRLNVGWMGEGTGCGGGKKRGRGYVVMGV